MLPLEEEMDKRRTHLPQQPSRLCFLDQQRAQVGSLSPQNTVLTRASGARRPGTAPRSLGQRLSPEQVTALGQAKCLLKEID